MRALNRTMWWPKQQVLRQVLTGAWKDTISTSPYLMLRVLQTRLSTMCHSFQGKSAVSSSTSPLGAAATGRPGGSRQMHHIGKSIHIVGTHRVNLESSPFCSLIHILFISWYLRLIDSAKMRGIVCLVVAVSSAFSGNGVSKVKHGLTFMSCPDRTTCCIGCWVKLIFFSVV